MGQQQMLLIIIGAIIVGTAIGVGMTRFGAHSAEANKDGITAGMLNIAADAYQFRIRPVTLGGGSGSYANYAIPRKMASDDEGTYSLNGAATRARIVVRAISAQDARRIALCTIDSAGGTAMSYSGW